MTDEAATVRVPELGWTTRREAGVTLVELTVTNDAAGPRRVRVRSTVPVLPPRRRGVPAAGWTEDADDEVVVLELAPGERRGVGYASPSVAEPPAELLEATVPKAPSAPAPIPGTPSVEPTPAGVVRELPSSLPPREAVPDGGGDEDDGDPGTGEQTPEPSGSTGTTDGRDGERGSGDGTVAPAGEWEWGSASDDTTAGAAPPAEVTEWFDGVAERIDTARALAAADTVPAATERVAAAGGVAAVEQLADSVDADPRRLRRLAARAERLAERAEGLDVPVAELRQLS